MNTTIQEQMKAVKKAMKDRENINNPRHNNFTLAKHYMADKYWKALNDAYSTLAAIALTTNMKPITGNTIAKIKEESHFHDAVSYMIGPRFTKNDLP
jgi:hypothetical protein